MLALSEGKMLPVINSNSERVCGRRGLCVCFCNLQGFLSMFMNRVATVRGGRSRC